MIKELVLDLLKSKVDVLKKEILLRRCTGLYRLTIDENNVIYKLEHELTRTILQKRSVKVMNTDRDVYEFARQIIKEKLDVKRSDQDNSS